MLRRKNNVAANKKIGGKVSKNNNDFLLGSIHTNVQALLDNQKIIYTKIGKLEADHNQRKGIGRAITVFFGVVGGYLGHLIPWGSHG